MAKCGEIISVLESIAPPSLALSFDNAGLNIGCIDSEITGITVCLDATEEVIKESIEKGNNLIVSHHPLIFTPIANLNCSYENYKAVALAIKNDINIYSMHTNLDAVKGGVNDTLASLLGVKNSQIIDKLDEESGLGRVGDIEQISLGALAQKIQELLCFPVRIIADSKDKKLSKIAVVNGSGADAEYLVKAKEMGAECFITSEVKHHIALFARAIKMPIIESGHYATERFFIPTLSTLIEKALNNKGYNLKTTVSEKEKCPYLD